MKSILSCPVFRLISCQQIVGEALSFLSAWKSTKSVGVRVHVGRRTPREKSVDDTVLVVRQEEQSGYWGSSGEDSTCKLSNTYSQLSLYIPVHTTATKMIVTWVPIVPNVRLRDLYLTRSWPRWPSLSLLLLRRLSRGRRQRRQRPLAIGGIRGVERGF